jgi:hypothetical protein
MCFRGGMDISGVMIGPMWKHHDASTVLITWLPTQSHALELLPLHRDKPLGDLAAMWQPTGVRMALPCAVRHPSRSAKRPWGADSVAQRSAVRRLSASGMAWRRRPFLVRARALHRHTSATHRRYGTHAPALLRLYETDARLNARVGAAEPGTHLVPADRRDLFFDEAFAAFAAAKARPALLAREALGAIVVQHLPRQHTQVKRTLRACVRACVCE